MALGFDRNPDSMAVPEIIGMRVADTIHMKASYGIDQAPGVVAILEDFRPDVPQALIGRTASIRIASGHCLSAPIEDVRDHGPTISLFFRDLTPEDVPIGSLIDLRP